MKKILLLTAFLCAVLTAGCQKEKPAAPVPQEEDTEIETPEKLRALDDESKRYLEGKHIFVLLGYGYNDEEFVQKTRIDIAQKFGLVSDEGDGLVRIAVYPEDFMRGSTARISQLFSLLEDENLAGIVILGAPEATHSALARLQDKNGGEYAYPVYSLFPQDDMLGSEATANFVLDYAQKTGVLVAAEDEEHVADFDADTLLANSIQTMLNPRLPIPAPEDLQAFVQTIVGPNRSISRYVDTESGLHAQNHFIFE